ncbi:hypothetical protein [Endozoicomonas lisbonensis]|uniref:IgGFc-binding protein N-terminal domain-containing protein n=1 Tax=Endozoicomonas lisbonensis TaxID=3120522 RepID=A0ABV2SJT6_9GAMM
MRLRKPHLFIAAMSFLSTSLLHAAISPECSKYNHLSEHYKTCKAYDKDKVKVLSGITDLSATVNSAKEGELLIIPARDTNNPYLLTAPLTLKEGMGLLSTGKGSQGFFHIAPGLHFSIGDDTVYSLMKMAEGSTVTGLGIDARRFSSTEIKTLKNLSVEKTLVHAKGIKQFTLTWSSLFGRAGLKSTVWADNEGSSSAESGVHKIGRSWLDSNGAENIAIFAGAGAGASESPQEVNLKHLMAITSGTPTNSDHQYGLWLKNVKGEVEHNYLFMPASTGSQKRTFLALDGLTDPTKGKQPTVAENYFYSKNKDLTQNDSALQLLQSSDHHLNVHIFANGITNNMLITSDNSPNAGKLVLREENYRMHPLKTTPSWEKFFDETNDITMWPRGGTCFTPLFAVTDLNQTMTDTGNDAWQELCGQGIKDHDFGLTYDYEGDNYSYLMAKIKQLKSDVNDYKIGTFSGWGAFAFTWIGIISKGFYSWRKGNFGT